MKFFVTILIIFTAFISNTAFASSGYFINIDSNSKNISVGNTVEIYLYVDSEELINAFDLSLLYPANLEFVRQENKGSIVSFWQSEKAVSRSGNIVLSGGMINPFKGEHGYLTKLIFNAKKEGNSVINFDRAYLFKSDGLATKIEANFSKFSLSIDPVISGKREEIKKYIPESKLMDSTPPELFAEKATDPVTGISLLVFSAKDKESGIYMTEMRYKKWFTWTPWSTISNPAPYPSSAWGVEVRTVNNTGQMTSKSIMNTWVLYIKLFVILASGIIVCIGAYRIFLKNTPSK